jgi:uroporphyrinogen decarboxylase
MALAHKEPDRVPYNLRPSEEMRKRLRQERGDPSIDFADFFNHDVRYVAIPLPKCPPGVPPREWVPRPGAEDIAKCREETRRLHERGVAVCGSYSCGVFEQAKHWFGDADTLTMPFGEPGRLGRELERITEWKMAIYGAYAQAGVDIVWIGDDLGTQKNLVMSPVQYRQWYRPCHAGIVGHLAKLRADVHVAFHCCGYVTALIPDLIEMGIGILEAVQAECMDIAQLKREFGKDLSFWGAVGAQSVLARTTPAQVVAGVRETLAVMAPGGGYIAAPCHTLTEEVPWDSVLAFHGAMQRYGGYPFPGSPGDADDGMHN